MSVYMAWPEEDPNVGQVGSAPPAGSTPPVPSAERRTGARPVTASGRRARARVALMITGAFVLVVAGLGVAGANAMWKLWNAGDQVVTRSAPLTEPATTPSTLSIPSRPSRPAPVVVDNQGGVQEASLTNGPNNASLTHDDLIWSVVGVPIDGALAVRGAPSATAPTLASLKPPARGLGVTGLARRSDGMLWREVALDDGGLGWVPAHQVTAQPVDWSVDRQGDDLVDATRGLWALLSDARDLPQVPALASTGVWFGGLGVLGPTPTPLTLVDSNRLVVPAGWLDTHDFSPSAEMASFCDGGCRTSPRQFVDMPEWGRPGVRLEIDAADRGAASHQGHVDIMGPMHSVTIDVPATEADGDDWQRIHVWFDWSEYEPRIVGVYTWRA